MLLARGCQQRDRSSSISKKGLFMEFYTVHTVYSKITLLAGLDLAGHDVIVCYVVAF